MTLRVLALTPYGPEGPSARQRVYNYRAQLALRDIAVQVQPFMSRGLYERRMSRKLRHLPSVAILSILRAGHRVITLYRARSRYDVVLVHRQLSPIAESVYLRLLDRTRLPVVFDLDDAVWLNYPIDDLLERSRVVIAGNEYLAAYVAARTLGDVVVIPTVVDVKSYPMRTADPAHPVVVGWIGTASTFYEYLEPVVTKIVNTCEQIGAVFRVISDKNCRDSCVRSGIQFVPWTLESAPSEVSRIDIGLMPLDDSEYSQGKCAFKLIEYGAVGRPSIAFATAANAEVVVDGETGWLVGSTDEMCERLPIMAANPDLRATMGRSARRRVSDRYSVEAWLPSLRGALVAAAGAGSQPKDG